MDGKLDAGAFEQMSSARRWRPGLATRDFLGAISQNKSERCHAIVLIEARQMYPAVLFVTGIRDALNRNTPWN
jgi:hypothetical protein